MPSLQTHPTKKLKNKPETGNLTTCQIKAQNSIEKDKKIQIFNDIINAIPASGEK